MTLAPERLRSPGDVGDPDRKAEFSKASAVARSALDLWLHVVRTVLLTVHRDGPQDALRGLAAWYERMCVDGDYESPAPEEGLAALRALEGTAQGPLDHSLVITHWAVRVARELAACRSQVWAPVQRPIVIGVALAKLDVALLGASERTTLRESADSTSARMRSVVERLGGPVTGSIPFPRAHDALTTSHRRTCSEKDCGRVLEDENPTRLCSFHAWCLGPDAPVGRQGVDRLT